jgi:hypothetical protein
MGRAGPSMVCGEKITVKRATESDLPSLLAIISHYRRESTEHLNGLLEVETTTPGELEGLAEALAAPDSAFFLAEASPKEPIAALWCRHLEHAPPVYQPQRSILSVKAFHSSTDGMTRIGVHLFDAAIEWAKSVSKQDELFVSSVTWAHDPAVREVIRSFHRTSTLVGNERYRELFTLNGNDARMRPATQWYFGRSEDVTSALSEGAPPATKVRRATESDLPRMVELSHKRRHQYARYQPVFWRPAEDADEKQVGFFGWLLQQEAPLVLVSEAGDGSLNGFIIALRMERLPMNDPAFRLRNGLHVDDFAVADDDVWSTVGKDLLLAAVTAHQERVGTDAAINVISGTHDLAKRRLLESDARMRALFTWDILPAGNLYEGPDY